MCRLSLMTDLALKSDVTARRAEVRAFMEEHVYPNEAALAREDESSDALIEELRAKAKDAGIWAPHLPPEAGGSGSGFMEYALLNEEIGRSMWAQLVFNCQAPDAGNGEILHLFGTEEQKERFLKPLVEGTARSFFSMTEPEVSGADPTGLRTTRRARRRRVGDQRAQVVLLLRRGRGVRDRDGGHRPGRAAAPADEPDPRPRRHARLRARSGRSRSWDTRAAAGRRTARCATPTSAFPRDNVLGEPGDGFRIAQKRLGPGRIHHVMRWLGQMQRAFELMCRYALEREAFGGPLAEKQTVQNWIADSAAEIQACRLLTLDAARKLDEGGEAQGRGLADQVLRRAGAERRDRPGDPGARRARAHRRDAARRRCTRWPAAARIYDGPDEVHRMVVSRRILKEFADGGVYRFD